jgi:hypothetical protein
MQMHTIPGSNHDSSIKKSKKLVRRGTYRKSENFIFRLDIMMT